MGMLLIFFEIKEALGKLDFRYRMNFEGKHIERVC